MREKKPSLARSPNAKTDHKRGKMIDRSTTVEASLTGALGTARPTSIAVVGRAFPSAPHAAELLIRSLFKSNLYLNPNRTPSVRTSSGRDRPESTQSTPLANATNAATKANVSSRLVEVFISRRNQLAEAPTIAQTITN